MFASNKSAAPSNGKLFVEDVFSTYLYTGNDATNNINNGIDLTGKGGMVWLKNRDSSTYTHFLFDTARGAGYSLSSNSTGAQQNYVTYQTFGSSGFSVIGGTALNVSPNNYTSWTFRKAPKFFDVVTYTGNGSTARAISHSLGVAPGSMFIKRTDSTGQWVVYHRSLGNANALLLESTSAQISTNVFGYTTPDATTFTVGDYNNINGATYVAYLFAHDATSDGIIQCGTYTTDASAKGSVTLGWEPQFVIAKSVTSVGPWCQFDTMRGMSLTSSKLLVPNATDAETSQNTIWPTATGFTDNGTVAASATIAYIAIRRGPMRTPTSGTTVFAPSTASGNITTNFPSDSAIAVSRAGGDSFSPYWASRLTGADSLTTSSTAATQANFWPGAWGSNTQFLGGLSANYASYNFRRAPSFFDEVCFSIATPGGTANHNLTVVPEMMIAKVRNISDAWYVYHKDIGATKYLVLNTTAAAVTDNSVWYNTAPTSSVFTVGGWLTAFNYVNYLFASCPGVSKVGSYTGNGSSQTINCGFAAGARFVLIKRTDSTGDWYVWDTARGIVAGNDPYFTINRTNGENVYGSFDTIDPVSSGFIVNEDGINCNTSGATYIYLAVA